MAIVIPLSPANRAVYFSVYPFFALKNLILMLSFAPK